MPGDTANTLDALRVLHLEDNLRDAKLVESILAGGGYQCLVKLVSSRDDFYQALERATFDVILADYSLPSFDGMTALEFVRRSYPSVPFIFVSGIMGEEAAIASLTRGAVDYILKPRLDRLAPAVRRALQDQAEREEKNRALQALEEAQQLTREIIASAQTGIVVLAGGERCVAWNPFMESLTGIPSSLALGRPGREVFSVLAADTVRKAIAGALTGHASPTQEIPFHSVSSGKTGWVTVTLSAQRDRQGSIVGVIAVICDITGQKNAEGIRIGLEAQLRQAQKLEAIGSLAGGIAHDFNNILAVIQGNLELVRTGPGLDSAAVEALGSVFAATERARDLVNQILTFSRRRDQKREHVWLQSLIDEALKMLRATLPAKIQIRSRRSHGVPAIFADASQIHQVVMNLCTNACQAMADSGGVLEIEESVVVLKGSEPQSNLDLLSGTYVRLTVSDTGVGMDKATLQHIFEPFFTTKSGGTGLGLAVVHGIVKSHDGAIAVESHPSIGTTFYVYLPAVDEPVKQTVPAVSRISHGHGERILFVDDEEALALIGKKILERFGYRVSAFSSPVEALAAFQAAPGNFDAVVTDLNMPLMTGVQLTGELIALRPDLPILLMSGYSGGMDGEDGRALGVSGFLPKPTSAEMLTAALNNLFAKSAASKASV
ncbi:MAG TPA: response regulator [Candidatus Limnocylindria bacterium]|nr:response regulator [Candidatus Limnocylindria bacterium]